MTTAVTTAPPGAVPPEVRTGSGSVLAPGGAPEVADAFVDLLRTVRRSKARLVAAAGDDVESAAQLLLRTVAADGPMRASALAASVHADLSTVSRQVATLVGRGLFERRADQEDGRASLLVVTDAGQAVIAAHEGVRAAFFEQTLQGWTPGERDQFARQLTRFARAYDDVHAQWMDEASRRPADAKDLTIEDEKTEDVKEGTTV
jgi:DNA-binding MarR family transcriptional regulator